MVASEYKKFPPLDTTDKVVGTLDTVKTNPEFICKVCPDSVNVVCEAPALCVWPFKESVVKLTSGNVAPVTGAIVAEYCA